MSLTGNHTIPSIPKPQIWHVVYADAHSCDTDEQKEKEDNVEVKQNYIAYELQMFNPDVLGNPTVHFSDEDIGKDINQTVLWLDLLLVIRLRMMEPCLYHTVPLYMYN